MGRRRTGVELSIAEWAVLALLAEGPAHGFAIARMLAPEGEVGRVWSLPRPLVYRALDALVQAGFAEPVGIEQGRGPQRVVMTGTAAGRRLVDSWLQEPVRHVRELRSELLIKLLFLSRAGASAARLVTAQRAVLAELETALVRQARRSSKFDRTIVLWRLESTRAALRFLEQLEPAEVAPVSARPSRTSPSRRR